MELWWAAGEGSVDGHQKRFRGCLERVGLHTPAAVQLAFVFEFDGHLCLSILAYGHGLHAEVAAAGGHAGCLLDC